MITEVYNIENEPKEIVDIFMDFLCYASYDGIVKAVAMNFYNDREITVTF